MRQNLRLFLCAKDCAKQSAKTVTFSDEVQTYADVVKLKPQNPQNNNGYNDNVKNTEQNANAH